MNFIDELQFINSQTESIKGNEKLYEYIYKELWLLINIGWEKGNADSYPNVFNYGSRVLAIVGESQQERSAVIDIIRNTWEFITEEKIKVLPEATIDEVQKNYFESRKPDKM